jgi:hypothetical protein
MSGRISIGFVDFTRFSFDFVRVRCVLIRLFLVRNWCGALGGLNAQGLCARDFRFRTKADDRWFIEVGLGPEPEESANDQSAL